MAGLDRSKRIVVRTALITGSTIATVIGAQSLALVDQIQFGTGAQVGAAAQNADPSAVVNAAPNIVILRQSSSATTGTQSTVSQSSGPVIRPPSPVELTAPTVTTQQQQQQNTQPVVQQQPQQQTYYYVPRARTRSS